MKAVAIVLFVLGTCLLALAALDYFGPINLEVFGQHFSATVNSDPFTLFLGGLLVIGGGALWLFAEHRRQSKDQSPKR